MNAKELWDSGADLFGKRSTLMMLWQEIADNFYPERADFTYKRQLGTDFAAHLMTSYPVLCRRDLQDQIGMMLRPTNKPWFKTGLLSGEKTSTDEQRWLERATKIQRRAMYDPKTLFTKATKQADGDWAAFGQTVISVRVSRNIEHLLYQTWHLRDCAWAENADGNIGQFYRKWRPTARDLSSFFPTTALHQSVAKAIEQSKHNQEFDVVHMVVEADIYSPRKPARTKHPWWSIWYDPDNDHIIQEVNTWNREYIVPRWQTVSGSQYAFSPATVAALPDARLLQAMTYTLLEAGEKVVNPPMVATQDAVRSDMSIYAGGLTWVDRDYDERLGEALRYMNIDAKGMPLSREMISDSRTLLTHCFYLNKLSLPQRGPEMTAYETGQRVQEYIRGALPLFEPMEMEYDAALCDLTFEHLLRFGAFGSPQDIPKRLQNADVVFSFQSPLHDAIEELEAHKFLEMGSYIAQAVQLDPEAAAVPDVQTALRAALSGAGVPAAWVRDEVTVRQVTEAARAAQQAQATLANLKTGSEVAANMAGAQRDQAQAVPA